MISLSSCFANPYREILQFFEVSMIKTESSSLNFFEKLKSSSDLIKARIRELFLIS